MRTFQVIAGRHEFAFTGTDELATSLMEFLEKVLPQTEDLYIYEI